MDASGLTDLRSAEERGRDGALKKVALGLSRVDLRRDLGVSVRPLQSVLVHRELRRRAEVTAGGRTRRDIKIDGRGT